MTLECTNELKIDLQPQALLSDHTTFRLGGPCPQLIHCENPQQLESVIKKLVKDKTKFILIGGGSNLVVSDAGVDCTVVRYVSETPLIERDGDDLVVSGSTALDDFALFAVDSGLEGLICTTGIPGTVGGAIVGNAGAFGKQVGDVLKSVTLITREGEKKTVSPQDLGFTYRNSKLKETGDIVVEARFGLKKGDRSTLAQKRAQILAIRHEKHPDLKIYPCAGSFFRNVEPTSKAEKRQAAGWFLEQAGGKALRVGGASIFEKHANIIVKGKDCRAQEVYELHLIMKKIVKEKFGLDLVREVRFVGNFAGKPVGLKDMIW